MVTVAAMLFTMLAEMLALAAMLGSMLTAKNASGKNKNCSGELYPGFAKQFSWFNYPGFIFVLAQQSATEPGFLSDGRCFGRLKQELIQNWAHATN